MPGQRRSASQRVAGSRLARLAGLGVALLLASAAVTIYLVAQRPAARHEPSLPTRVLSFQTVGIIAQAAQPGSAAGQLLQLLVLQRRAVISSSPGIVGFAGGGLVTAAPG